MEQVLLVRASGERASLDTEVLRGADGEALAEVSQAPPLLVDVTLRQLRAAPAVSAEERLRALGDAGKLFAAAELEGETPEEYVRKVALATGVPVSVVATALSGFRDLLPRMGEMVDVQRPVGSSTARWLPRGRVLGVVAPSNHPMVHIEWLQAIAFGYRVLVRPGGRDPFSPRRLARALFAAGLRRDWLAVLPGPHAVGEALLRDADLGLVYGGESTVQQYRDRARVATRGPGRAKALVTEGGGIDWLLEQIAGDGGVRCNNVSAVLCEAGHDEVADALAAGLTGLPARPVLAPDAVLPVHGMATAVALRRLLESTLDDDAVLVSDEPLVELDGGQAVLRPAVVRVDRHDHLALGVELPFPCVWVAPWLRAEGVERLRHSLAVLLPADVDRDLLDAVLAEPSIRAVVCGDRGAWWADPLLPHDGYLGHFLMECRGAVV